MTPVRIAAEVAQQDGMADTLKVFIDLNNAGLDLDPNELEAYSQRLADELNDGLAEESKLVRLPHAPDGSKAGEAGFDLGILKAEVNLKNLKAVLDWLGQKVYGSTIKLEYGEVKLEYRTPQQLQDQLQALERISELKIRVVKSEAGKG